MGYEIVGYVQIYNRANKTWEMVDLKRYNKFRNKYEYVDIFSCGRTDYHDYLLEKSYSLDDEDNDKANIATDEDWGVEDNTVQFYGISLETIQNVVYKFKYDVKDKYEMMTREEIDDIIDFFSGLADDIRAIIRLAEEFADDYDVRYVFMESY